MQRSPQLCSDCESFDRRSFLKTAGVATLAGVAMPMFVGQAGLFAAPTAVFKNERRSNDSQSEHN